MMSKRPTALPYLRGDPKTASSRRAIDLTVSEVLGHKEVAITLDRYSHACPPCRLGPWHGWTRSWAARRDGAQRAARMRWGRRVRAG